MSFHLSAENIRIEENHLLKARLPNEHGELIDAEINLNQFIGNSNGNFEWEGENFSNSAQNVTFSIEGGDGVPVLRADLFNVEGELVHNNLNLSERIENQNGVLVFV